jgi:hypothetical protein
MRYIRAPQALYYCRRSGGGHHNGEALFSLFLPAATKMTIDKQTNKQQNETKQKCIRTQNAKHGYRRGLIRGLSCGGQSKWLMPV